MDYQQWRNQYQLDQHQPPAKAPKLQLFDQSQHSPDSALALFGAEPSANKTTITTIPSLPPLPDSAPTRYPRMRGFFTLAQWQELELQALIYKYMLAGASVPMELILPLKGSLLTPSPYYQQYQHFQSAMLQSGYWGRCVVDPEPGRCRRTDGKKWRCSRDVVAGAKYCERHVHRGRSRSRKHVEIPTPTGNTSGFKATLPTPLAAATKETQFSLTSTLNILPLNQRPPDSKTATGILSQSCRLDFSNQELQDERPDGRVLRRFFDDWPRSEQESTATTSNASSTASPTSLSISIPSAALSDFSLKLSTGTGEGSKQDSEDGGMRSLPPPSNWSGWGSHGEASMGGPLAEALRSSACTPSPTSVLPKPNGSVSETSSIST